MSSFVTQFIDKDPYSRNFLIQVFQQIKRFSEGVAKIRVGVENEAIVLALVEEHVHLWWE